MEEKRKYQTSSYETDTVVPLVSHFDMYGTVKCVFLHVKSHGSGLFLGYVGILFF
jgi:hypothetical protein